LKISLSPTGKPCIESALVSLGEVGPIVNEQPLGDWRVEIARDDSSGWGVRYVASELTFGIEVNRESETRCWLRYWIEGLDENASLDSFGLRFERAEKDILRPAAELLMIPNEGRSHHHAKRQSRRDSSHTRGLGQRQAPSRQGGYGWQARSYKAYRKWRRLGSLLHGWTRDLRDRLRRCLLKSEPDGHLR